MEKGVYKYPSKRQNRVIFSFSQGKKQGWFFCLRLSKKKMEQSNAMILESKNEKENMGHGVHSQVIKIKQEIEKIKQPSLEIHMRRVFLRDVTRIRSRSPLGLTERAILVGNS